MKKIFTLLSVLILATAFFACTAKEVKKETKPELRPAQKLMQDRAAWMAAMNENLGAKKFDVVVEKANALSAQTKASGDKIPNPLGRELTLAISSLAGEVSIAAARQDIDAVKAGLGQIKGKCSECHAKIRNKK